MKAQIAIVAGGLAIAGAVAYAELKPASNTSTTIPAADPNAGKSAQTPAQDQGVSQSAPQSSLKQTPSTTQGKITNPNSKPQIAGGRGGDDEGNEGGERHGWFGGDDD
jgi:hypothetical protein